MLIREAEHRAICDTLHDIYVAKNSDYGNSFVEVRNEFPESVLIRLSDKLNRLKALMKDPEKRKVNDESIDDTLMDLANYAILELVERKFDEHFGKLVVNYGDSSSKKPEIIHCRDCKFWVRYDEDYPFGFCYFPKHYFQTEDYYDISILRHFDGDFFCADAETKEVVCDESD